MKKLIAEFDKNISLFKFDDKINELMLVFPKDLSVLIRVSCLKDKILATLSLNPDINSIERKVWEIK